MKAIIIGHGYCGKRIATLCQQQHFDLSIYSRSQHNLDLDSNNNAPINADGAIIFYTVPPQKQGDKDKRIKQFLKLLQGKARTIVYFGSTSVYGDHEGEWVDENSKVRLETPRAFRRYHAEETLSHYCRKHDIACGLLRIAAIYGPERISLHNIFNHKAVIKADEAPFCNYVHVDDLCNIAFEFAQQLHGIEILNVADGNPQPSGSISRIVASLCNMELEEKSLLEIYKDASPQYREFIQQSKRINIDKLHKLGYAIQHPDINSALPQLLQLSTKENFVCVS